MQKKQKRGKNMTDLDKSKKEDKKETKTVTDILEEIKQEMCDDYCKHPTIVNDREDLFVKDRPCMECPLNKL